MDESISKSVVMDFVETLTNFVVHICKKLLVKKEELVPQIAPAIAYLEQAEVNLPEYLNKVESSLPRRINKEDLVEIFNAHGLFRSYKLRAAIVGKFKSPRIASQKELQKAIPTSSPPKRLGASFRQNSK